jgi:hypothetical protein
MRPSADCKGTLVAKETSQIRPFDIAPHGKGALLVPARAWKDGDVVNLKFLRMGDILVDEYNLAVNPPPERELPTPRGPAPRVEETTGGIDPVPFGRDLDPAHRRVSRDDPDGPAVQGCAPAGIVVIAQHQ